MQGSSSSSSASMTAASSYNSQGQSHIPAITGGVLTHVPYATPSLAVNGSNVQHQNVTYL